MPVELPFISEATKNEVLTKLGSPRSNVDTLDRFTEDVFTKVWEANNDLVIALNRPLREIYDPLRRNRVAWGIAVVISAYDIEIESVLIPNLINLKSDNIEVAEQILKEALPLSSQGTKYNPKEVTQFLLTPQPSILDNLIATKSRSYLNDLLVDVTDSHPEGRDYTFAGAAAMHRILQENWPRVNRFNIAEVSTAARAQFYTLNQLVETRGYPDGSTLDYEFAFDRRNDQTAPLTADRIRVSKLSEPLEEWVGRVVPQEFKTEEGEEWLEIAIEPRDPHNTRIASWTEDRGDREEQTFYCTENLIIHLSNHGRGFQQVEWRLVLNPDDHKIQSPEFAYLKSYPAPEGVEKLDHDPDRNQESRLGDLHMQSLERLAFLVRQVQEGNIINPTPGM